MKKNESIRMIIQFNRIANTAIAKKEYGTAQKYLLKLHKLERKERASLGSYRLRGVV